MTHEEFFDALAAFSSTRAAGTPLMNFHEFHQLRICRARENFSVWKADLAMLRLEALRSQCKDVVVSSTLEACHVRSLPIHAALLRLFDTMKYKSITDLMDPDVKLYYSGIAPELAAPGLAVTVTLHYARLKVALRGKEDEVATMRSTIERLIAKSEEGINNYCKEEVPA